MQNRRCVERERCGTGVHGRSFPYAGCRGGFRFGRCRSGRQRKNENRMKRRVHAGYVAVCAACVLFHAACGRWSGAPWYLDRAQLQTDYLADAAVSDASEVYRDLPCIVSPDSGDGLEWTERGGRQFVLVCSMTDGEYAGVWTAGRQFVTDGYTLWVVLPYELEERMRRMPLMGDSLECRMRMLQLLGLPPDSPYDRLLFFYADRSMLLRPCPNPAVGACAVPDVCTVPGMVRGADGAFIRRGESVSVDASRIYL